MVNHLQYQLLRAQMLTSRVSGGGPGRVLRSFLAFGFIGTTDVRYFMFASLFAGNNNISWLSMTQGTSIDVAANKFR